MRVGIDVGGTFTDLFAYDEASGETYSSKVLTTLDNQALGVIQSVAAGEVDLAVVSFLAHGTTTGTNSLIERKGSACGLLTTQGFRDVLEIMRTDREFGYDLGWEKPRPLVPRRLRAEVPERVLKDGTVELPLDEDAARVAIAELLAAGVEAIAISLLHSYANPDHERRLRELVREADPSVAVSLSSEVNAEYREYERTNTTVVDAYIKPVMVRYIERLVSELESGGLVPRPFLMQGSGGMVTADRATERPIGTLSSGPAAGAIAAAKIARAAGFGDIVTFDVGGTSTDVALIHGGQPYLSTQKQVEWGLPARVPMLDVESVGAGGGSIGWIDQGGALKMGPQSAGSDPGPICYDAGGTDPALSDALLLRGVLGEQLAAGRVVLDREAARAGVLDRLAEPLGLSLERVVTGMVEIAHGNMANAVRSVSIWKGLDPRELTLVAFGGAGGMVAGEVARTLGIPRVLIPPVPGNACAMGLLMTDFQEDESVAYLARASDVDLDDLNERLATLQERTVSTLQRQGVADADVQVSHIADIRYHGQIHELRVPFDEFPVTAGALERTIARFEDTYEEIYTIRLSGGVPEMVSLRVVASGALPQYEPARYAGGSHDAGSSDSREVLEGDQWRPVDVYRRYDLGAGTSLPGPVILEEEGSTVWVASGMSVEIDTQGNLLIATSTEREPVGASSLAEEVV
jgi:N-methylhydantoinase A